MDKILVVGAGSWGTAFADYLGRTLGPVRIWVREEEVLRSIREKKENQRFLAGFPLSPNLVAVDNLETEAANADILVYAVPSKFSRDVFERLRPVIDHQVIVNLSKGFEASSLMTLSQLARHVLGDRIISQWVTISGPSFARELAQHHPTAVVAVSYIDTLLEKIQRSFSSPELRIYRNTDLAGIEVAASMKNVMAIASGIVHGSGYGYNTTASLITRATVEISRLGRRLGGRKETFWGLAGIGDLMLTCFGPLSRNFQLGVQVASGRNLKEIEAGMVMIAEGVETTRAAYNLAKHLEIEMPITEKVYEVLFQNKNPRSALQELMQRRLKPE
ncbi:MAG: NAD(P)-dependent glycerol-3-phosphate dehydrogenase [Candidatus Aminicenantes bacterium]|nr:NAD(P)-dependent glycerol-3-phosphate dehydrogenase [Candidatus Aminicenantes bacterium]